MATDQAHPQEPERQGGAPVDRRRPDWEAIERDYRTGQFSNQELVEKYGNCITRQAISKRALARGWQKDLSREVRRATRAKLIVERAAEVAEDVAKKVAKGTDATYEAVLAAAEANKQVVLGHRRDIAKLSSITMGLVDQLELAASEKDEAKRAPLGELVLAAQRAGQAMVRLQNAERVAFGLDEPEDAAAGVGGVSQLTDAQRASRLAMLIEKARRAQDDAS